MKWVGLTGGIGTGKSTVASLLGQRSVPVIDADQIAKSALASDSPVFSKILDAFGQQIVDQSLGQIDRKKMAEVVFGDSEQKRKLESIVHPFVQTQVQALKQRYAAQGTPLLIYDVPLLFENNLQDQFDGVIVVHCTKEKQIQRISKRNPDWTVQQIDQRIKNQWPLEEKIRRATWAIENNLGLGELEQRLDEVLKQIRSGKS